MSKRPLSGLLSAALILIGGTGAKAGEIIDSVSFSSLAEINLALGTADGDLQKAETVFTPEVSVDLSPSTRLTLIGRLRIDAEDDLEPAKPFQGNRAGFTQRGFIGNHADAELREAYIDTEIGNSFLRIGKQQIVWGQADGLKVLDILNPQSFREFILPDFEDSRIPLWSVNAEIPIGNTFLQLVWIPDRTYDDIPEAGATFAFTSPEIVPAAPAGVPVSFLGFERPDDFLGDSDVGVKLAAFVGGWDLSLNYAFHYFDRPVARREIAPTGIDIRRSYERTHTVGGTLSNVFGDFTLRAEIGFSSDRFYLTDDLTDADGVIGSGELSYVLGLDYSGWRDWFISAQIFQSVLTGPAPGLVRDKVDTSMTLLVRRDFMNEALLAEVLVIQSINNGDGVVQASLTYEWRSNVRLKLGADIFYGNADGLFGQFDGADRVTMGVEVGL